MHANAERVETVFTAAVAKANAGEREAYLDGACGGDPGLRERVEALLASHDAADGFLRDPVDLGDVASTADLSALRITERPGTVIGRYKLLQLIGEGGFGSVFMAEQDHPVRRTVALKVIKVGMDTKQVIARFGAERQALALMDHPNIARVLDAGATDAGRPYFVMELVKGVPITDYCDANHLSTRERLELFIPVCHAVQHAHQKGVIHRDIKPSNIMVTIADGTPIPKVIDFGIAKATNARLTEATLFTEYRQMVGTPAYMSPEQAESTGIDVDTRSDVYSLGVLLYELLTGTTPFDPRELRGKAYAEIQRMIREVDPPRPSTRISGLGETLATTAAHRRSEPRKLGPLMRRDLDWVVMKCLEKDRTRRYETASALGADVRRYLGDEAVQARPTSAAYRAAKFVRKHKVAAAAAAAVVFALACGMALATYGLVKADSRRREADRARADEAVHRTKAEAALASAERQRLAAESNERRATAATDFLNNMLQSPNPYMGLGTKDVSVRQMLDGAAAELDHGGLSGQPDAEAATRVTLGRTYQSLGLEDAAERQLLAAITLLRGRANATGAGSVDLAVALSVLADLLDNQGASEAEAEAHFKEALAILESLPASADPVRRDAARVETLVRLAFWNHWYAHDDAEAERLAREALRLIGTRPTAGRIDLPHALGANQLLASVHTNRNEFPEAEAACREAMRLCRESAAGQRSATGRAFTLCTIGHLRLRDGGGPAEAARCFREALELFGGSFGEDNPPLWVVRDLADALVKAGDAAGAERLLLDQHARLDAVPGVPAARRVELLRAIVSFYERAGGDRRDEQVAAWAPKLRTLSLAMLDEQIESKTRRLVARGDDARLLLGRGVLNSRRGRFEEAAADLRRATALDPSEHLAWFSRGCLLAYLGKADYRQVAGEMLARFEASPSLPTKEHTANTCLLLAHSGQDVPRLGRIVDAALAMPPQALTTPWLHLSKGLAEYRAGEGHYEAAVRHLDLSRPGLPAGNAEMTVDLLRAMCLHRLDRADARAAYQDARRRFDRDVVRAGEGDLGDGGLEYWLILQVIRREAADLFGDAVPASRPTTRPAAAAARGVG